MVAIGTNPANTARDAATPAVVQRTTLRDFLATERDLRVAAHLLSRRALSSAVKRSVGFVADANCLASPDMASTSR
jgi:hypothetical protein